MRESRFMIIVSFILMIMIALIGLMLNKLGISYEICFNIATNLYCAVIVGLITSICQYYLSKQRVVNTIYNLYFDFYKTYYYSKNTRILYHYDMLSIYKKMSELFPKINEALNEYYGFFKKEDRFYKKLNPSLEIGNRYKAKSIIKSLFLFNTKSFERIIEPFANEIENTMIKIDEKRFKKDKEAMIKMYNCIWK